MKTKILATSDLHGFLPQIKQRTHILLIAGDISPLYIQEDRLKMKNWLSDTFIPWTKTVPVDKIVLIAGNHDFFFMDTPKHEILTLFKPINKIMYLDNEAAPCYVNNTKLMIYGTPYCHKYGLWAFMESDDKLKELYNNIPKNVDIIISHDAPHSFGDTDVLLEYGQTDHLGNKPLADKLLQTDYKLAVCGHIHSGDHSFNETFKIANVSYLNEYYKPAYPIFNFDL
jgi:Icc-related predicted phosphoesterase